MNCFDSQKAACHPSIFLLDTGSADCRRDSRLSCHEFGAWIQVGCGHSHWTLSFWSKSKFLCRQRPNWLQVAIRPDQFSGTVAYRLIWFVSQPSLWRLYSLLPKYASRMYALGNLRTGQQRTERRWTFQGMENTWQWAPSKVKAS